MAIQKFYFVGNAHLDPAWQWRWQEGSAEAKATIRSALDRMEEFPDFRFACAGSRVFKWIETYDPGMFEEIRRRVREKRFIVVGGMFIQPDCNLPSGEGFVRQTLYAQRYFNQRFGITARTGYNVDSFGHSATLPQILRKSGMDSYVFMRPGKHEKELPAHVMRWQAPDGSEVLAARLVLPYCTSDLSLENAEHLDALMAKTERETWEGYDRAFLFYGVGNHGGGPTIRNIQAIESHRQQHPETEHIFSDVHDFFEELEQSREILPVVKGDLQHHASGCYSAVSTVKSQVRRAEWDLYGAENFSMLAWGLLGRRFASPRDFESAWEEVLFSHFHDIMGGCCVPEAYEDADISLKAARAFAHRTENDALQSVSWHIDTSDAGKGIPIVVFNPHPFPVRAPVAVRLRIESVLTGGSEKPVPVQHVRGSDSRCRGIGGDTLFLAELPALGYRTYYFRTKLAEAGFTAFSKLYPQKPSPQCSASQVFAKGHVLENEHLRVRFDSNGQIVSMYHKDAGRELLQGSGAVPVVLEDADCDTWAHGKLRWDKVLGTFGNAQLQVLENGPVRATVKVESTWGSSTLAQYFSLYQGSNQLDVRATVDWQEHRKMLKLRFDTAFTENPQAWYEIPYGIFRRPADGEEEPGHGFAAVLSGDEGLAVLSDCKYSYSVMQNRLHMTVLRSPFYNDHGTGDQQDTESELTDQGLQKFRYSLLPVSSDWSQTIRRAKLLNKGPTVIVENNHKGTLPDMLEGFRSSADNVIVSAWKEAEAGGGMILRAYETDGKAVEAEISGPLLPKALRAEFKPFSIQTYFLAEGSDSWKEVLLTEFDM